VLDDDHGEVAKIAVKHRGTEKGRISLVKVDDVFFPSFKFADRAVDRPKQFTHCVP
jgi:hypothetical protein